MNVGECIYGFINVMINVGKSYLYKDIFVFQSTIINIFWRRSRGMSLSKKRWAWPGRDKRREMGVVKKDVKEVAIRKEGCGRGGGRGKKETYSQLYIT